MLQLLDIVFAVFGLIGSNVFIATAQTAVRTTFALTSSHLHRADLPIFFVTLVCFTIVEIARYGTNFFASIGMKDSPIARVLQAVRWNSFIICYPLGASLEGVMHCYAIPTLKQMDPMPYSITMPNKLNFAFNFSYFLTMLPIAMILQFPSNYTYLLAKRRQYYANLKAERDAKAKKD